MTDVFTKEKRSEIMANVKGKNTTPEIVVRSIIHQMGYRFRLHRRDLPGIPDIVLPKHKKVIFVHGCFWHGHKGCTRSKRPSSNQDFWDTKLNKNMERDIRSKKELKNLGWKVLVLWECKTKRPQDLNKKLMNFLNHTP